MLWSRTSLTAGSARWLSATSGAGFLVLCVAVRYGWTDGWDVDLRELARPRDVWGTTQLRADLVVEGLRPVVVGAALAVLTVVVCGWRRSLRPAVLSAVVGGVAAVLTVGSKLAVDRADPHGAASSHGGSFPSGHTVSVLVCLGVAVLLLRPAARGPLWLLPGAAAGLMAVALVLQAAHWTTDVVGGGLLGTAVLAGVSAAGLGRWSMASGRRSAGVAGGTGRVPGPR